MYAFSADMSTIRQKEIRKEEFLREQRSKTSLKTGYALPVESARNTLKKKAESTKIRYAPRKLPIAC